MAMQKVREAYQFIAGDEYTIADMAIHGGRSKRVAGSHRVKGHIPTLLAVITCRGVNHRAGRRAAR
jgi:hypothetical protein